MANIAVCHENYLDPTVYVSMSVSSEKAQMRASNVLAGVRRTKVYRSDGYWNITSDNNQIIFREASGGSDLTATIAVGEYISDEAFRAAVKDALDTAGESEYAVERDSTSHRLKITATLGGSATTFELMTTDEGFTAAGILGFSTTSDLSGSLTYTADVLKIHTEEWFKWDFGISVNPKAFFAIGLRNVPFKLSENAVMKIQGSPVDTTEGWESPDCDITLDYTRFGVAALDPKGLHTEALRYWRFLIQDPSNILGYVELSNLYLGDFVVTERGKAQFPLRTRPIDLSVRMDARSGASHSDVIQITEEHSFSWRHLTVAEKEALEDFAREVGITEPWFICLDPNEFVGTDRERHVKYVKFTEMPTFELVRAGNWSSDWTIREEL